MTDPRRDVAERQHELLEILRHHLPPKTYFRAKKLLLGLIGTPSDSPAGEPGTVTADCPYCGQEYRVATGLLGTKPAEADSP